MASAEAEEDFIANKLTKKLELLRAEKNELLATVELEEEYLTNNLQKKLNQVRLIVLHSSQSKTLSGDQ